MKVFKTFVLLMTLMAVNLPVTFEQIQNINNNVDNSTIDYTASDIHTIFPTFSVQNYFTAHVKVYWYNEAGCIAAIKYSYPILNNNAVSFRSQVLSMTIPIKIWYEISLKDDKGKTYYCVGEMYNIPYPSPYLLIILYGLLRGVCSVQKL